MFRDTHIYIYIYIIYVIYVTILSRTLRMGSFQLNFLFDKKIQDYEEALQDMMENGGFAPGRPWKTWEVLLWIGRGLDS